MLCTLVACFKNFGGYACSDLAPVSTCFSFYGGQYVVLFLGETVRHGHFNNYTLDIAETMGNATLLLLFSLFFASLFRFRHSMFEGYDCKLSTSLDAG